MVAARSIRATGKSQRMPSPASTTRGSGVDTVSRSAPGPGAGQRAVVLDQPLLGQHPRRRRARGRSGAARPVSRSLSRALVQLVDQRVRVQLDHRAAVPADQRRAPVLEPLQHRDVVQRSEPGGAEERRPPGIDRPVQPEPPDRERRRGAQRRHPSLRRRRRRCRRPSSRSGWSRVGGQHDRGGRDLGPRTQRDLDDRRRVDGRSPAPPSARRPPVRRDSRPSGAQKHGVVVVVGHVEQQTLRRPQEVGVEHRHQLAGREVAPGGRRSCGRTPPGPDAGPRPGSGAGPGTAPRSPRRTRRRCPGSPRPATPWPRARPPRPGPAGGSDGLWATKAAMFSGGVRGILANESAWPPASTSG